MVRGKINEKTADSQARSFMATTLGENGKNDKLKEKQKWSHEELHLENARKLRGIYFIDPEDKEFKDTIKNARKKLETPVAPAMPCKIMKKCGSGASNKTKKQDLRVFWRLINPKDCVWEKYQIIMKTMMQEKETIHCNIVIWITNLFLCLMQKNPSSKGSSGQGMGKIGENFGVEPDESQK